MKYIFTTVFLQSDAVATIFSTARFSAATIQGQCLFLWEAHRLLDAVSSLHSLSVLLSAVETSCTT